MGHELESEVLVEGTPVEMHAEPQRALSNPTQAPAPVAPVVKSGPILPPERSSPHLASLNGIHIPEDDPPPAPPPIAAKLGMDSFVSPSRPATPGPTGHRPPKRTGGVVAAPPLASTAPAEPGIGASMFASFINAATSTSLTKNTAAPVTSGETRKMRQPVVEGPREQDYFKERTEGFVKPLGEVTVWAAAGANQLAFEASGGVENGVVTNALCSALAACGGKIPTRREVWRYLT
ncbi:hypothetical protein BDV93DRAFT_243038 [Ceratobasidium sp. AG-I]|nr:hypothetical protein BDV93DRAFT_243038 [Ceratobasidium sp. AG-I]